MDICTQYDDFMGDSTIWIATLNDGTEVYRDDGRPNMSERSAWLRLKKYCEAENKFITGFRIKFRDHIEYIQPNKDAYFFSLGALGIFGQVLRSYEYFITGYLENGVFHITKWIVPEIIIESQETREIEKCLHAIIKKPDITLNIQTNQFSQQT